MKALWLLVPTLYCSGTLFVHAENTTSGETDYSQMGAEIAAKAKKYAEAGKKDPSLLKIRDQSQQLVEKQAGAVQTVAEQAIKNARSGEAQAQIQKVFPDLNSSDLKKVMGGQGDQQSVVYHGPVMFISMSMPEPVIKDVFRISVEKGIPLNLIGLVTESPRLQDTVMYLKKMAKEAGLSQEPWIQLAPNDFIKYHINMVPTLVQDNGQGSFHRMEGSINIDFFNEKVKEAASDNDFLNEKAGVSWPIKEKNLIDDLKERMTKIDWDAKKKKAVDNFWNNQNYIDLPPAQKNESWAIDPTVRVIKDVTGRNGQVLARAGEVRNPLTVVPVQVRMFVINPLRPEEIQFVEKYRQQKPFKGQTVIMGTSFTRDRGWDVLENTTKTLKARIYLAPNEVINRFHVSGTPAVIETAGKVLHVQQFDIRIPDNNQEIHKTGVTSER